MGNKSRRQLIGASIMALFIVIGMMFLFDNINKSPEDLEEVEVIEIDPDKQKLDENLVYKLNSFLSENISIKHIFEVADDMHARFSATFRTYEYYISLEKDPFSKDASWQYWRQKPLNIDLMNEACKILFEYEDFTSFAKLHTDNKTNICKIYKAEWELLGNQLKFTISADRFLRNMVRAIVGTMVEVGTGKITPDDLKKIIEDKFRNSAGVSAPAQGLFLVDVGYEFKLYLNLQIKI